MSATIEDIESHRDVKYTLECPYCHERVRGNNVEHLGHRQACEVMWASKSEDEKSEMERRRQEAAAALPREQRVITTLDNAKRILARDAFIGMLIRPHLQATESGIILDPSYVEGSEEYIRVFYRSQYVRVMRVSECLSRDRFGDLNYPFLAQWREAIDDDCIGPVIRVKSDSGTPCKGTNDTAMLILYGSDVLAELGSEEDVPSQE